MSRLNSRLSVSLGWIMKIQLDINRTHFSRAFWSILFERSAFYNDKIREAIQAENDCLERGRTVSDFNTGSISYSSSLCIASVAAYFQPECVAEVGTFIGRSAFSLLKGAELAGAGAPKIYSCDYSNDIPLHFSSAENVIRYPKTSSTAMFSTLLQQKIYPDLYFIDGRLQQEDAEILMGLGASDAIFILDDFVGTEKGVANAFLLQQLFPESFLMAYPVEEPLISKFQVFDTPVVAVMVPTTRVRFTN